MYKKYRIERMPTQSEQDIVEEYLSRELNRPDTTIAKAIIYLLLLLITSELLTVIICLVKNVLVVSFNTSFIICFSDSNSWSSVLSINLKVLLFVFIVTSRITLIGLVRLYQHYAPEQMRRRCLCKPSCSEYMILAIKKYGPFIGTAKGIRRLLITCDGIVYKIDYP